MKITGFKSILGRLRHHHDDNVTRGVYGYMWLSGLKIILAWFLVMVPVILIFRYFIDLKPFIDYILNNFSNGFVLIVFLLSESFLGMIPPDFFVIWTAKFQTPMLLLTLLGILSYIGGIISYFLGKWISERPKIKPYIEKALEKYIILVRKWGGAFIVIAALFPFSPLSLVVIAVGLLKYPFKLYLLFGISRIIRFLLQGLMYTGLFRLDSII